MLLGCKDQCLPTFGWHWIFFPSSGQVVTSGMFSSIFKLNTTLGNLFAHDYGCVPILLVVRPEVSQHYNLKFIGWNQVLVPKF